MQDEPPDDRGKGDKEDQRIFESASDNIMTRRFVRDVEAGIPDSVLKARYNLGGRKLALFKLAAQEFIKKYAPSRPKKKIVAEEVVRDIKAGMDDESLKEKYVLTDRQLQRLYRKIIAGRYMTVTELASRLSVTKSQITEAFEQVAEATGEFDNDL